jgi:hypothetical protein
MSARAENAEISDIPPMARRTLPRLRVGDVVEVRSAEEILATLDQKAELENLPFMPEMLQFCGKRMTVHKVAHKLCDFITGTGQRWMNDAVHLTGARCSGQAHGGCQTACSLYWKEAWLRPVTPDTAPQQTTRTSNSADIAVLGRVTRKEPAADGSERFSCQGTEMLRSAPERIRLWDLDQYVADVRTGNATVFAVMRTILFQLFNFYQNRTSRYLPRWLLLKGGLAWGFIKGSVVGPTPTGRLDLQVGEVVRIKSKDEIARTLDAKKLNRGMGFEEEMARSCGRTAKVLRRVDRCIDERTGKLVTVKNPCIVLEGVVCPGVYHGNCPREYIPFWREIWLDRVDDTGKTKTPQP